MENGPDMLTINYAPTLGWLATEDNIYHTKKRLRTLKGAMNYRTLSCVVKHTYYGSLGTVRILSKAAEAYPVQGTVAI